MPTVNGLFSALDLRSETRPSIAIAVVPQSAHPILRQTIAWALAALCALLALGLVAFEKTPLRPHIGNRLASALRAPQPVDGVVAALLLGWWVLAPTSLDDG